MAADMYGKNEQGERALRDVAMFQLTGIDVHFSPTRMSGRADALLPL
jgi:hypothetical protein